MRARRKKFQIIFMWILLALILSCCVPTAGLDQQYPSLVEYTAFIHVNVIPMTHESLDVDQTVLIAGDRIVDVGPADKVSIPPNARIIDSEGGYLMPGLADMHMHTRQDWESREWPVSPLLLYLANGVTTIRDFGPSGDELTYALEWRDQIKAGGAHWSNYLC